ncbi:DUF4446 family protein [Marinicrinis lubricantis]|uniref:DUF4446 family protein n=1 Tax=Marinicrinis lubricantis TaxID=2086470 RepID=A0ABW1IJ40_9BACL
MDHMMEQNAEWILLAVAAALCILFIIIVLTLWVKLGKLRKLYMKMLGGEPSSNLEELLIRIQEQLKVDSERLKEHDQAIERINQKLRKMKGNAAVIRYSAFSQQGNNLSFSMAIVDEESSGVVLSGIHTREESYVYAKPVVNGQSEYALSPEEKEALHQALIKKD